MKRSRTAFALGLVAPLLVVSGCSGGDPQPKIAPSVPVSSSSSGVPPASTSADPARSDVVSLLDEFFARVGESTTSGNPKLFLRLASSQCQNCQTLADNIRLAYGDGGHVEGGHWEVVSARQVSNTDEGAVWNVSVKTARERWFDGSGHLTKIVRASTTKFGVIVAEAGSSQVVREIRLRS